MYLFEGNCLVLVGMKEKKRLTRTQKYKVRVNYQSDQVTKRTQTLEARKNVK